MLQNPFPPSPAGEKAEVRKARRKPLKVDLYEDLRLRGMVDVRKMKHANVKFFPFRGLKYERTFILQLNSGNLAGNGKTNKVRSLACYCSRTAIILGHTLYSQRMIEVWNSAGEFHRDDGCFSASTFRRFLCG